MNDIMETNLIVVGMFTILAVVSPGPDFAIILRNGLRYGRKLGLATAMGIACGVVVHTTYTLLGLGYIVSTYAWVLESVRYVGAAYLVWLGVSAFIPQKEGGPVQCAEESRQLSFGGAFRHGFFCNALNPKTMLFFIALFTQVVSPTTPLSVQVGVGVFISIAHLVWFSFVVLVLTDTRTLKLFGQWQRTLEKVVGGCLLGLGVKLVLDD